MGNGHVEVIGNCAMVPSDPIAAGMQSVEGFAGRELTRTAETSTTALAERARAEIESRYVMALRRPRDFHMARDRMLKECKRPGFAEVARYAKPVGGGKKAE